MSIKAGRVRDCNNDMALRLQGSERTGPDILLFFVKKCPHVREELLKGELPPYPWRISQATAQEQKIIEKEQKATPADQEKDNWFLRLYRITITSFWYAFWDKVLRR